MNTLATFLTQEQVERVHAASLEILENTGMLVRHEKARRLFERNGCQVDSEKQVVKFPRKVVEQFRLMIPPTFTFRGRAPQFDRTLPDDSPVVVTGSSAPNIMDPVTGQERRSRSDDIARIAHLINNLPGYDVFSISTLADDAAPGQFTVLTGEQALAARVLTGAAVREDGLLTETLTLLETNIDDLNPQVYEHVLTRLLAAGALDVTLTPMQMKKNRPATQLAVLCRPGDADALLPIILRETTTLGVRRIPIERVSLPRSLETVETRYGSVRVKVARWNAAAPRSIPAAPVTRPGLPPACGWPC